MSDDAIKNDKAADAINQLPGTWEVVRVDQAGAVRLGRQRSPKNVSNKYPTPYIRAGNITWGGLALESVFEMEFTPDEREVFELRPGDVLLSEASGSANEVGKAAIWPKGMGLHCFQNTVLRFRPEALQPRYALHLFTRYAQSGVFAAASRGVGIHHLSARRFAEIDIPVPPLKEQGRIADRIDELFTQLDAGVAALKRVQKKLPRYRAALLHAAATGRLTEDWRTEHGKPDENGQALLQRILKARREDWVGRTRKRYEFDEREPPKNWKNRYVEPEASFPKDVPLLPGNWCWTTHDHVGHVQLGRQRAPQHHSGDHMRPYLRVANVHDDEIDTSDILHMNFTPKEFFTYGLDDGDILLNEGQSMELVGRPAIYRGELEGGCFQNTIVRQRVFEGVVPEYAYLVIREQFKLGRYRKIARITTSIAHLGAERFAGVEFPLPPTEEQAVIVERVNEKMSQIDAMEDEVYRGLLRASRLRQVVLKTAFAGKLIPQNLNDEPASVLLGRLRAQADKQVIEKKKLTRKKSSKKKTAKRPLKKKK